MVAGGSSHAPDREYLQLFTATHCTVSKSAASHHDTPLDLRNKDFRLLRSKLTRLFTKKKSLPKVVLWVSQDATLFSGQETHKLRKEAKL